MPTYRGTADQPDRAKAVAAVIAVHAALAFVILSGLSVQSVNRVVDQLKTFNLQPPPPPPPVPPPPKPQPRAAMKKPQGAPAKTAAPTPVVAPPPRIPAPSPVVVATVAGTGSAATSGAASSGSGTGAGGSGYGMGGGGGGTFSPAQKITKIPNQEYRRLAAASGMDRGTVGLSITVMPDGLPTRCRIVRSSGSGVADALMCELTERYIRFRPARDPAGRPVAQDVTWFPNWWRP